MRQPQTAVSAYSVFWVWYIALPSPTSSGAEASAPEEVGHAWLTFHNQVSLKSHDILKSILHVIDNNEPLSIANAIEKELKISPVFPWPITSKTDLQGRKIVAGINFGVFPAQL